MLFLFQIYLLLICQLTLMPIPIPTAFRLHVLIYQLV